MKEFIKNQELTEVVKRNIYEYGVIVNEERAVPCLIDGLKPVQRRVLWSMYNLGLAKGPPVKAARTVGDTIGRYHPHGDTATYEAMVKLANHIVPLVLGEGNWGSITGDRAAAYRYTNAKLTAYGAAFFDPYYMPVLDMVPNYDGKDQEPVYLFAPLPNLLLNGSDGIGVGMTAENPAYTVKSVIALLRHCINNGPATPLACYKYLDFTCASNGRVCRSEQKAALKTLYTTGTSSIRWNSIVQLDLQKKAWHLIGSAPFQGGTSYMKKIWGAQALEGVSNVVDNSKSSLDFWFYTDGRNIEAVGKNLYAYLTSTSHYKCCVNKRTRVVTTVGLPEVQVSLHSMTVPQIVNEWLVYRRDLEVRATTWQLQQLEKHLRRNEIFLLAVKQREYILSLIRNVELTDAQIKNGLRKNLHLDTEEEVEVVFNLQWRKLRSLEGKSLQQEREQLECQKVEYKSRIKKPEPWILAHLEKLEAACSI